MNTPTIAWSKGCIKLIDQTKLPQKLSYVYCRDLKTLWQAIKQLKVRGAPALGVAAAFGILLGAKQFKGSSMVKFKHHLRKVSKYIATSRPTAVNLFNMLERMQAVIDQDRSQSVTSLVKKLEKKAKEIYEEDRVVCRRMGNYGAKLLKPNSNVMTVCNAGALATVDYGTALGVMYAARAKGKNFRVYANETRPLLQGARLTAWELLRGKIDTTLICDNMAATLMKQGKVDAVFTGADRIALNGDTANKIGTYSLAVLASHHAIPFYIVAPLSTFDTAIKTGKEIPIEQREKKEVTGFAAQSTAPKKVKVYNPAFDVTDAKLITAIVTEAGIINPPFKTNIKKIFQSNGQLKKR